MSILGGGHVGKEEGEKRDYGCVMLVDLIQYLYTYVVISESYLGR